MRGSSCKTTCKITHGTRNATPFIADNLFRLHRAPDHFSMAQATIKAIPLSCSQPFVKMTHSGLPGDVLNHQEKCHPLICVGSCGRSESAGPCKHSWNDPSRSVMTKYEENSNIFWLFFLKKSLNFRHVTMMLTVFLLTVISLSNLTSLKLLLKFSFSLFGLNTPWGEYYIFESWQMPHSI